MIGCGGIWFVCVETELLGCERLGQLTTLVDMFVDWESLVVLCVMLV
jgi:hypothetical protein